MPAIDFDTELLLDILFGLVVLFFVPFGVRRGVAKEAMVSAGVLFGAVVADRWAIRGGDELVERFAVSPETARFAVAVACLGVGAAVLGYGGGAALGRLRQGVHARLTGGLLAAVNGALILAYVFAYLERYLWPGQGVGVLDDGLVGRALLRDFDWLLLAAAAIVGLCVLLGWIVTGFRRRNEPLGAPSGEAPGIPSRQRPVRLPRGGDAGKFEPDAGPPPPEPRPGRFGGGNPALDHTAPILDRPDRPEPWRADDEPGTGASWPRPRAGLDLGHAANGHAVKPTGAADWLQQRPERFRLDGSQGGAPASSGGDDAGFRRPPSARSSGLGDERRCPTCAAALGPHDVFCPECGTTL